MRAAGWTPQGALAEGLRDHVRTWALARGASAADARLAGEAAAAVSRATAEGHVCVRLHEVGDEPSALRASLRASRVVGEPGTTEPMPLVLDAADRLYLHRYFDYERRLAHRLLQAAEAGLLSIVSGGPGTGKTTRIVAELGRLLAGDRTLRIALAAPTGKAAARMSDAIRERAGELPQELRHLLPSESSTVHRLLRFHPPAGFEHDRENPLAIDVLVVDEASMLDLALATRLLEAVPPAARIVLLGDKDQLAAVESGAVFAEISSDPALLPVTLLAKNWRFPEDSGIGRLAAGIRQAQAGPIVDWLRAGSDPGVRWDERAAAVALAEEGHRPFFDAVLREARDVPGIAGAFAGFRVLCAVRGGPDGVEAINRELTARARTLLRSPGAGEWYAGRPVMVRVNDYAMRLFNGDVGLALPDTEGQLMVWFEGTDGWRPVPPARVPPHETAYAMTVHKSQGSEFGRVLVVLPPADSPVLTRELLYTGVTRAREGVRLQGSEGALRAAIGRATQRHSGLLDRIREDASALQRA